VESQNKNESVKFMEKEQKADKKGVCGVTICSLVEWEKYRLQGGEGYNFQSKNLLLQLKVQDHWNISADSNPYVKKLREINFGKKPGVEIPCQFPHALPKFQ
jgi:hypothetical protein